MHYTINGEIIHSAKGSTWKKHKYYKKENGRYYYINDQGAEEAANELTIPLDRMEAHEKVYEKTRDSYTGGWVFSNTGKNYKPGFIEYLTAIIAEAGDKLLGKYRYPEAETLTDDAIAKLIKDKDEERKKLAKK